MSLVHLRVHGAEFPLKPAGLNVLSGTFVISSRLWARYSIPMAALTGPAHASNNWPVILAAKSSMAFWAVHQVVPATYSLAACEGAPLPNTSIGTQPG